MTNATRELHKLGQSLWLDSITRRLLTGGTLHRFVQEFAITGITSNFAIFERAIQKSHDYDYDISQKLKEGKSGEALFFELVIEDLRQSADLFQPIHKKSNGVDGWVSLEVSPLLAHDTAGTIAAAKKLHSRVARPNLLIKIPATKEGLPAIEECLFAGVPVYVTLLFSRQQYLAAAEAYVCGIERRITAGLNPNVGSVAAMSISRWDDAVVDKAPEALRDQLGLAVAGQAYQAYCDLVKSPRWERIFQAGAHRQRLLWSSTGTLDPEARAFEYVQALAAPFTVSTIHETTLRALGDHGEISKTFSVPSISSENVLAKFAKAGLDTDLQAIQIQEQEVKSGVESWNELLACIASKVETLTIAAENLNKKRP